MKRMPVVNKTTLSTFRLLDLKEGKSVSQMANEFGLSNSDVVCIITPFIRAGLAARKKVSEDWRRDVYYSLQYENQVAGSAKEDELRELKERVAEDKKQLNSLQEELARKEDSVTTGRQVSTARDLKLGEGKTISQIEKETGLNPTRIHQVMDPLVQSGVIGQKYLSQGHYFYYPTKKVKEMAPAVPTEEEIKKLRGEIRKLRDEITEKEETIRKEIKLAVLRSLDLGKGKSAGQIAARTGMSIADVIGVMMAFVRSGLIEQSFTPTGFFYAPPITMKAVVAEVPEVIPPVAPIAPVAPVIPAKPIEEIPSKRVEKELVTPAETRRGVELFTPGEAHTRIELFEELLGKLTVRELVLLREKINLELRKR